MFYYLIYTSTPTEDISINMMQNITTASIARNSENEITGMLMGIEGKFLQYLEGDEQKVLETYERITNDPRHKKIFKWVSGFSGERIFQDWSMASWLVSNDELTNLTAIKDLRSFLKDPLNEHLQSKKFLQMMETLLHTWIAHESERMKKSRDQLSN